MKIRIKGYQLPIAIVYLHLCPSRPSIHRPGVMLVNISACLLQKVLYWIEISLARVISFDLLFFFFLNWLCYLYPFLTSKGRYSCWEHELKWQLYMLPCWIIFNLLSLSYKDCRFRLWSHARILCKIFSSWQRSDRFLCNHCIPKLWDPLASSQHQIFKSWPDSHWWESGPRIASAIRERHMWETRIEQKFSRITRSSGTCGEFLAFSVQWRSICWLWMQFYSDSIQW